jgi:SPP1 gp7 family putative phage head morphogenesis protein
MMYFMPLHDGLIQNQVDLERYGEGVKKQIFSLLTGLQDEIAGQIAKYDPAAPALTKWRLERMKKLNSTLSRVLKDSFAEIKALSDRELKDLVKFQAEAIPKIFNVALGVDIFDVTLTPGFLKSVVSNTLIDGNIIGKWWENARENTRKRLEQGLNATMERVQMGLIKGDSVGEMIRVVRGTKDTPGILEATQREVAALVRTSILQVTNAARLEMYNQNADILKGYQVVATLDTRTTPLCRGLDGKQYDLQFNPIGHNTPYPGGGPPFHWNCRSTLIPITKTYEELAGKTSGLTRKQRAALGDLPEGMRASIGGPVPAGMNYNQWLKTQDIETQKEVLGPGRWRLWKDNKLTMSDLLHQSGRPLTLIELMAKYED